MSNNKYRPLLQHAFRTHHPLRPKTVVQRRTSLPVSQVRRPSDKAQNPPCSNTYGSPGVGRQVRTPDEAKVARSEQRIPFPPLLQIATTPRLTLSLGCPASVGLCASGGRFEDRPASRFVPSCADAAPVPRPPSCPHVNLWPSPQRHFLRSSGHGRRRPVERLVAPVLGHAARWPKPAGPHLGRRARSLVVGDTFEATKCVSSFFGGLSILRYTCPTSDLCLLCLSDLVNLMVSTRKDLEE